MSVLIPKIEEDFPDDGDDLWRLLRKENHKVESWLFRQWKQMFVGTLIELYKCSEEDAEEIYYDSFAAMIFNIRHNHLSLPLRSKLSTYCIGIGKNLAMKRFRKKNRYAVVDQDHLANLVEQLGVENEDLFSRDGNWGMMVDRMRSLLGSIGEKCQQILKAKFWYNYSHKDMIEEYDYASEEASRQQLFRCINKMRAKLMTNNKQKTKGL